MILYFSATGNSRHIAQLLSKGLNDNKIVDLRTFYHKGSQTDSFLLSDNETICFVFPVHSWGMPKNLATLIGGLRFGNYNKDRNHCALVLTCGDDAGQTARQWKEAVAKCGLEGDAAFSVFMPNTYVLLPGFNIDNRELTAKKLNAAPSLVENITERIKNREKGDFTFHGSFSRLKSKVIYPFFMRYMTSDKPFVCNPKTCIECGKCVKVCPTGNIQLEKTQEGLLLPHWHGDCMNCLACYHHCPTRSIEYGRSTRKKGTYHYR